MFDPVLAADARASGAAMARTHSRCGGTGRTDWQGARPGRAAIAMAFFLKKNPMPFSGICACKLHQCVWQSPKSTQLTLQLTLRSNTSLPAAFSLHAGSQKKGESA
jgi:hypothetical protein